MQSIAIQCRDLPPSPNQTKGLHWAQLNQIKQRWQQEVGWKARQAYRGAPLARAHIHFHISTGDNRPRDPDNLAWSVTKPALDGMKGIIIEDDTIDRIELSYSFDRAKPKGFRIEVTALPS